MLASLRETRPVIPNQAQRKVSTWRSRTRNFLYAALVSGENSNCESGDDAL